MRLFTPKTNKIAQKNSVHNERCYLLAVISYGLFYCSRLFAVSTALAASGA